MTEVEFEQLRPWIPLLPLLLIPLAIPFAFIPPIFQAYRRRRKRQ